MAVSRERRRAPGAAEREERRREGLRRNPDFCEMVARAAAEMVAHASVDELAAFAFGSYAAAETWGERQRALQTQRVTMGETEEFVCCCCARAESDGAESAEWRSASCASSAARTASRSE